MADLTTDVLQLYATHPFDSDELYQVSIYLPGTEANNLSLSKSCKQGLSSIISNDALAATPDEEKEALLRRTRIFYFEKYASIDFATSKSRSKSRSTHWH